MGKNKLPDIPSLPPLESYLEALERHQPTQRNEERQLSPEEVIAVLRKQLGASGVEKVIKALAQDVEFERETTCPTLAKKYENHDNSQRRLLGLIGKAHEYQQPQRDTRIKIVRTNDSTQVMCDYYCRSGRTEAPGAWDAVPSRGCAITRNICPYSEVKIF